jgi:hypothetical protein
MLLARADEVRWAGPMGLDHRAAQRERTSALLVEARALARRIPYSSQKVRFSSVDRCTYTAHEPSSFSNLQKRWSGEEAVELSTGRSTRHEPPTLLISAIKPEDDVIMPVILPRARANGALLGS